VAQKVEVVLTCDLDSESTPAVETVVFGYGGQTYEFELCKAHLEEFHDWARANGYEVNDRGRIPAHVRQAYEAAQH